MSHRKRSKPTSLIVVGKAASSHDPVLLSSSSHHALASFTRDWPHEDYQYGWRCNECNEEFHRLPLYHSDDGDGIDCCLSCRAELLADAKIDGAWAFLEEKVPLSQPPKLTRATPAKSSRINTPAKLKSTKTTPLKAASPPKKKTDPVQPSSKSVKGTPSPTDERRGGAKQKTQQPTTTLQQSIEEGRPIVAEEDEGSAAPPASLVPVGAAVMGVCDPDLVKQHGACVAFAFSTTGHSEHTVGGSTKKTDESKDSVYFGVLRQRDQQVFFVKKGAQERSNAFAKLWKLGGAQRLLLVADTALELRNEDPTELLLRSCAPDLIGSGSTDGLAIPLYGTFYMDAALLSDKKATSSSSRRMAHRCPPIGTLQVSGITSEQEGNQQLIATVASTATAKKLTGLERRLEHHVRLR